MPIFSLPSPYGIGTLGVEAKRFVDFLEKAGQTYWQILPLNPTNFGDSPYQSFSSFAGNPYFIDLDLLKDQGLLKKEEILSFDFGTNPYKIDYEKLYLNRLKLLKIAFSRFNKTKEFDLFCKNNAHWLNGYALFMALKEKNNGSAWYTWEKHLANQEEPVLQNAKDENWEEIIFQKFLQFIEKLCK